MSELKLRGDALAILQAAIGAVQGGEAVRRAWPKAVADIRLPDYRRIFLVAAGKAASDMAGAVEKLLGKRLTAGVIVTKHGHAARAARRCTVHEAGHPVPDEAGVAAVRQIENLLRELNAEDLLVVALSGGASALLSAPVPGITLRDKQRTTQMLLRAGANIRELNTVRKHLSTLKGGKLAALAYPATVLSLILSDVIGDPLDVIASGPTAPDPTTFADALSVLHKYALLERVPRRVREHLEQGVSETPKRGDEFFANVHNVVVASNGQALEAARKKAERLGYKTLILSSTIEGEARELGRMHGAIVREMVESGRPLIGPACVLSGGEPTVTVEGRGKGGRAQELALGASLALGGVPGCILLCAGTDGTDGPTDAAGAWVDGRTLARGWEKGLSVHECLSENDSYPFFEEIKGLVKTGPTGTNVMDITIGLAEGRRHGKRSARE